MFGANIDAHIYDDAHVYNDAHVYDDGHAHQDALVPDAQPIDAASTPLTCSSTPPISLGSADSDVCTETLTVNGCTSDLVGPCQVDLGPVDTGFAVMLSSVTCNNTFVSVPCSAPTATRVTCKTVIIDCGSGSD